MSRDCPQEMAAEYEAKGWPSIDPYSQDYCYQPCLYGVHVCGPHPDGINCLSEANFPALNEKGARALFAKARAEFEARDGEPDDLIVDLMIDGDILEDFPMSRQMLGRLRLALEGQSHDD